MELTYGDQTIDLDIGDEVILSLSGGLDSASLLYLILTHFPDTTVWPVCGRDVNNPFDAECADDVVHFMNQMFSENKLQPLYVFDFNDRDPVILKEAQAQIDAGINVHAGSAVGVAKNILTSRAFKEIQLLHPGAQFVEGLTQNPPVDEMIKHGFYELGLRTRDPGAEKPKSTVVRPYMDVDKKFVAGVYNEHGLMNSLYTLTNSCTGTRYETNAYSRPCEKCFWCHEKKWAFGKY